MTSARLLEWQNLERHSTAQWGKVCVSALTRHYSPCWVHYQHNERLTGRTMSPHWCMSTLPQSMRALGAAPFPWCLAENHISRSIYNHGFPATRGRSQQGLCCSPLRRKAYDIAAACADEAGKWQKKDYDVRVREAVAAPEVWVLVKAVDQEQTWGSLGSSALPGPVAAQPGPSGVCCQARGWVWSG